MFLSKCVLIFLINTLLIQNGVLIQNSFDNLHKQKSYFLQHFFQVLNNDPVKIRAYLCLPLHYSIELMKNIGALKRQIMIHDFRQSPIIDWTSAHQEFFIVDLDCKGALNFLIQNEEQNIFLSPFHWLLLGRNIIHDIQFTYNNKIHLLPDSNVIIVESNENNNTWILKQPYKVNKNSNVIIENYGTWSKNDGFIDNRTTIIISRRRMNLKGTLLKTSIVVSNNDSLKHLSDYKDIHIDTVPKMNSIFASCLFDSLNTTRETNYLNVWGYRQPNSTQYTGVIGQLQRKEIDISASPVFMTSDRISIIQYVAATTPARTKFVFRQPPLSYVSNVYTLPFTRTVWIYQGLLTILITAILYITLKWEKIKYDKLNQHYKKIESSDVVLVTIGAVCQQGSVIEPKGGPGRIIILILFLTLMFLYTSYSANIVALLQSSSNSIRTLADLLNSKLELGVQDVFYNRHYFKTATEPVRKAIYERKIAPPGKKENFMSIEEGVRRMQNEPFAFHIETGALYKLIADTFLENEKCGLMEIEYLQVIDPFLIAQKNSSYLELFKIGLQKMHERGILNREYKIFFSEKPKCLGTGNSFSSVGLNEIIAAFYILCIGMICAAIIAVIEYFFMKK